MDLLFYDIMVVMDRYFHDSLSLLRYLPNKI